MASAAAKLPRFAQKILDRTATDAQLRALIPDPAIEAALRVPDLSYRALITTVLDGYAGRPAMGARAYDVVADRATGRAERAYRPHFDTIDYRILHDRIKAVAVAWAGDGPRRVAPGDFVCILGFTSIDYAVVDIACAYAHAVSVPLQSTLAGADLDGIFTDTAPAAVAATVTDLLLAARLAGRHRSVRTIVALDHDPRVDADREAVLAATAELAANGSPATIVALGDLIASARPDDWRPLPPDPAGVDRMAILLHSSGSTGTPKGAIVPERATKAMWGANPPSVPVVKLAFAPMNHLTGRNMVFGTLARGGTIFFTARPDLSDLFDDIRLVRPTEIVFFPRALEMIHRHFLGETVRRKARGAISGPGAPEPGGIEAEVMAEMRAGFLGDRVAFMNVGGAPTTPELKRFIDQCFDMSIADGYGSTEMGAVIAVRDRIIRPLVIDYRLRDVPELGYYTTDKPYPRGELCAKTRLSSPGYYKRPEATAKLFDEDGFILTGDIVEERGPDHVVYIDRRNDVLKLSQGEYVAIGAIGTAFENGSDLIEQVYAYGNAARSYILAVIVPNMEVAEGLLGPHPDELALRSLIRSELKRVAAADRLRSFEVPRDFIVEHIAFTHENGLLSSVHKRLRPALQRRYGDRLEALYAAMERQQTADLVALQDGSSPLGVLEKVGKALEAALGIHDVDVTRRDSFAELGGDSLGAAGFATLLEDIFGVDLPVNTILSPAGHPQAWARAIEAAQRNESGGMADAAAIHGRGATTLDAADLDIAAFIDAATLDLAPTDPPPSVSRHILLTGANGFLGRFLCLEWLERMRALGGRVTCLVRAADRDAAACRLASAFDADPALAAHFRALAADHLDILVGDVAEPRLGLDPESFDRVARSVDHIVHPAALVNHILDYADLFGPNVAGTAELVRLALTHRQKRIDFVSSVATIPLLERGAGTAEDAPLRRTIALTGRYGAGYGASKWAAEQLLHSAHARFGLPVAIFRGDMMLAHSRAPGQINVPDIFTRLLYSLVMTGLAPASFYRRGPDGGRAPAHYDGLPVDFVAGAIAGIGAAASPGIRTFHVLNHHAGDGLSLDVFVDWIAEAGYAIERVADHAEWLRRFEAKLAALPEEKRQLSSLHVLKSLAEPERTDIAMAGSTAFQAAVRDLPIGPEAPHLDRPFILKCLADMRQLGLIPPPDASPSS